MIGCAGTTTTNIIWVTWNDTASTATCTSTAWNGWICGVGSAGGTAGGSGGNGGTTVWTTWINVGTGTNGVIHLVYPNVRQQTQEEISAQAALQAKYAREAKEREEKRLKAEKAALKLFLGIVGRRAYAAFKKRGYHEIVGHSGKRYRLRSGQRVMEMHENFGDKVSADLCILPNLNVPAMDTLVMQMLLIMSGDEGEKMLHKTANRFERAAA